MSRQPAGEPDVRHPRRVIGVVVGQELHVDPANRNLQLREADHRATPGIDQKFAVAGLNQRARAEAVWARDRRAGPEQGDAEIRRHVLILIPASLMTLVQRTVSARTSAPNCSGVPPPTSAPSLASDSRTFSVVSALFTAPFRREITSGGVPDLT